MKKYLLERRTKMLKDICRGVPLQRVVPDLAEEYGVTENAIYQDWGRREDWMPEVVRLEDNSLLYELINGIKQVVPSAWIEYKKADNSNAKIGALRLVEKTYKDLIKLLQSAGMVEKKPDQLEVSSDPLKIIVEDNYACSKMEASQETE